MTQAAPPDSHGTADIDRPDYGPKARWRRSALRACSSKARAVALVAVLTPIFNRQMECFVSNGWLQDETGLGERAIRYGLGDLVKAKQIAIDVNGPKRTIRAIVPTAPKTQKGEQDVHGKPEQIIPGKPEQIVPGSANAYPERFRSKAGINHSPIGVRDFPYPLKLSLHVRLPWPVRVMRRRSALASSRPGWMMLRHRSGCHSAPPVRPLTRLGIFLKREACSPRSALHVAERRQLHRWGRVRNWSAASSTMAPASSLSKQSLYQPRQRRRRRCRISP